MRGLYYVLRILVNALAILFAAWLLPGIEIVDDRWWIYMVCACVRS